MGSRISFPALQIVTASWSTPLPSEFIRIGISRGGPRRQRGYRRLPALAPGHSYRAVGEEEYIRLYRALLSALRPEEIHDQIRCLAEGAPTAALVCFEQPETGAWCHRSMAAGWLADALGIAVPEWGFDHLGSAEHPMLPPSLSK
jgi:hypothetical protein